MLHMHISAPVAWLLQVTEIDTLIGEPVVRQERADSKGGVPHPEAVQNLDVPHSPGAAKRGVEAGVQTDDTAFAAEETERQLKHSQGMPSSMARLQSNASQAAFIIRHI